MAFDVNSDANYKAYLAELATKSGGEVDEFKDQFIRYLMFQITQATVPSTATALAQAKNSVRAKKSLF